MRSTITAAIAASLLMLTMAAPALAGQPQVMAYATCTTADGGTEPEVSPTYEGSKGQIRLQILAWSRTVDCDKGSVETFIL